VNHLFTYLSAVVLLLCQCKSHKLGPADGHNVAKNSLAAGLSRPAYSAPADPL